MPRSAMNSTSRPRLRTVLLFSALGGLPQACDPGPPDSDIYGTAMEIVVPDDGSAPSTFPWAGRQIDAIVGSGADEKTLSTVVDANGAFHIANVPAGSFWLAYPDEGRNGVYDGKTYLRTSRREFDLSHRSDRLLWGLGKLLNIPVQLVGLAPLALDDRLELIRDDSAASWGSMSVGADAISFPPGVLIPSRRYPAERITALQWRKLTQDGVEWHAAIRGGSVPAPMADATALEIPLSDAPAKKLSLSLDPGAFVRSLAPLPATQLRFTLDVSAQRPAQSSALGFGIRLVYATAQSTVAVGLEQGERDYVDPAPASWTRRYEVRYEVSRAYDVPGETARAACATSVMVSGDISELATGPVRPRVSLPGALEIGGHGALDAPFSVGLSPTVRWDAPVAGKADFYRLDLVELRFDKQFATPGVPVATFLTSETALILPAEVLKRGASYYMKLTAVSGSSESLEAAPRQQLSRQSVAGTSHLCSAPFKVEMSK